MELEPSPSSSSSNWRYLKADFNKTNELLAGTNLEQLLDTSDVNQMLQIWENTFISIMEICIPRGTLPRRRNLPCLTKNLKQSTTKRNTLYRRAKPSGSPELWRKFKDM